MKHKQLFLKWGRIKGFILLCVINSACWGGFVDAPIAPQSTSASPPLISCKIFTTANCGNPQQFIPIRQNKCDQPSCQLIFLRSYCLGQPDIAVNSVGFQTCAEVFQTANLEGSFSEEEKSTLNAKYGKVAADESKKKFAAFSKLRANIRKRQAFSEVADLPKSLNFHAKETIVPLDANGNLMPEGIKEWLQQQELVNKNLFAPGCLDITEPEVSGAAVDKLFLIKYNPECLKITPAFPGEKKLILIVKKIKGVRQNEQNPGDRAALEIYRLDLLRNNPKIRQISAVRDPRYPQLTFAEEFYQYPEGNGRMGIISVLHAAKGDALYSYVKAWKSPLAWQKALDGFKKLGETLAHFHRQFMEGNDCSILGGGQLENCKTMIHADLHPNNVFYDGKFIYFIDLETMQADPRFFIQDLSYLYALPMLRWKINGYPLRSLPQLARFYKACYRGFLEEYLNTITADVKVRNQIRRAVAEDILRYARRPR